MVRSTYAFYAHTRAPLSESITISLCSLWLCTTWAHRSQILFVTYVNRQRHARGAAAAHHAPRDRAGRRRAAGAGRRGSMPTRRLLPGLLATVGCLMDEYTGFMRTSAAPASAKPCPCSRPELCEPIATPLHSRREIFGFGSGNWEHFDWSVLTTVVPTALHPTDIDPQLICHAHAHGVRVVAFAPGGTEGAGGQAAQLMPLSANLTTRRLWVQGAVSLVRELHLDGLNFDFEAPLNSSDPRRAYYAAVVAETRAGLRDAGLHTASISIDVGWSPDNVDGRYYDIPALTAAADFLYVMDYDVRSQVIDRCLAGANSPIGAATFGLSKWLQAGVPPKQLILGVPWYGYGYSCIDDAGPDTASLTNPVSPFCVIKQVPFRGVGCSDAAGAEMAYVSLQKLLVENRTTTGRRWSNSTGSSWFNWVDIDPKDGQRRLHQMWFDDPVSCLLKYRAAASLGIGGVGPYEFSDLDYSQNATAEAVEQTRMMWRALAEFKLM